jgi:hypothetical protein
VTWRWGSVRDGRWAGLRLGARFARAARDYFFREPLTAYSFLESLPLRSLLESLAVVCLLDPPAVVSFWGPLWNGNGVPVSSNVSAEIEARDSAGAHALHDLQCAGALGDRDSISG